MSATSRPTGHLQVKPDRKGGTRSYWAFWRDQHGVRGGCRLGPAHVRDSGRRTPRGAVIWRAGNGPRPTSEHLTPRDAEERLDAILREMEGKSQLYDDQGELGTLWQATQGWAAERTRDKDLKRSTLVLYETMFERLYRDHGADTPVRDFSDGRLQDYFDDFKSNKVISEKTAMNARAEGKDVQRIEVERWERPAAGQRAGRGGHKGRGRSARRQPARHVAPSAPRGLPGRSAERPARQIRHLC